MPTDTGLDVVTGAFGYTGKHIARLLLANGRRVRTLTGHPKRPNPFGGAIDVARYDFEDAGRLRESLRGATTLYNTYWIRYEHGAATFERAVRNSKRMFDAAAEAGVRRIVHISVTKTEEGAALGLPYFVGKLEVERALKESSHLSWAIVRPSVIVGVEDILMNNIAWLLRRLPVFAIPGDGRYRIRPVTVGDLATVAVEAGAADDKRILDAVGPDSYSFEEIVRLIRSAVHSRSRIVHTSAETALRLSRVIGPLVRDRVITQGEIDGMMAELVTTDGPATGRTRFLDWLAGTAPRLGKRYASEMARHYR